MLGIAHRLRRRARATARSVAFTAFGLLFCIVGIGFLTAALWQYLAELYTPLTATGAIGGLYLVTGLILFLIASAGRPVHGAAEERPSRADDRAQAEPLFQMAQGFAVGMQAGRAARHGPDREAA